MKKATTFILFMVLSVASMYAQTKFMNTDFVISKKVGIIVTEECDTIVPVGKVLVTLENKNFGTAGNVAKLTVLQDGKEMITRRWSGKRLSIARLTKDETQNYCIADENFMHAFLMTIDGESYVVDLHAKEL